MRPFSDRTLLTTQNPLAHSEKAVIAARRLLHARLGLPTALAATVALAELLLIGPHGLYPRWYFFPGVVATAIIVGYGTHFFLCWRRGESLRVSSIAWPKTGHPLENRVPGLTQSRVLAMLSGVIIMLAYDKLMHIAPPAQVHFWFNAFCLISGAMYPLALATTIRMREQWATVLLWIGAAGFWIAGYSFDVFAAMFGGMILMGVLLHARFLDIRDAAPRANDDAPLTAP
jgi:hypothetical protein